MIKFSAYLIGDQRKRLVKQTNSVYKKRREHRIKRLEKIKVYNTCAGYSYGVNRKGSKLPGDIDHKKDQPYEDQYAFINDPIGLAESLLSEGYSAMKIWPFDQFVPNNDGNMIDLQELEEGSEP